MVSSVTLLELSDCWHYINIYVCMSCVYCYVICVHVGYPYICVCMSFIDIALHCRPIIIIIMHVLYLVPIVTQSQTELHDR